MMLYPRETNVVERYTGYNSSVVSGSDTYCRVPIELCILTNGGLPIINRLGDQYIKI